MSRSENQITSFEGKSTRQLTASVAGFEEGVDFLLEHVTDGPGGRVSNPQLHVLVVARGRHERDLGAVGAPVDVGPVAAATDDVIAERAAMGIGRHGEARDPRRLDVDHHPVQHEDVLVSRQRIFPRLQLRMADARVDEIHLADFPCRRVGR